MKVGGVQPYLCSSVSGKSLPSHKTRARSCLKNVTPELTIYGVLHHFGGDRMDGYVLSIHLFTYSPAFITATKSGKMRVR